MKTETKKPSWRIYMDALSATGAIQATGQDMFHGKEVENIVELAIEPYIELLKKAVKQAGEDWYAQIKSVDWFNNNTPNVGQTIDYQSYPPMPEWLKEAEEILKQK